MATETKSREKVFNIRFSGEEWSRMEMVAQYHGLSAAALFRLLLKKEEREVLSTVLPQVSAEVRAAVKRNPDAYPAGGDVDLKTTKAWKKRPAVAKKTAAKRRAGKA